MSGGGSWFRRLEREILGEKAAALGRAGEHLEQALEAVTAIAQRLQAIVSSTERKRLLAAYEGARQEAARARLALVIQREALGLRQHRIVDQQFPDPPPMDIRE